jgi:hypothetical protein
MNERHHEHAPESLYVMQTISLPISTLLKRVQQNRYQIPQFQRPFRWQASQVKLLVDSITRSFPIGSLLVLQKSTELSLHSRKLEAILRSDDQEKGVEDADLDELNETYYVLDGQQRITSIARVFLNAHESKSYYFDLKTMLGQLKTDLESGDTSWIKVLQKGKKDPERKSSNQLMRADIALDQQKSDIYISEYMEDSDDFPELSRQERRTEAARLKGYFEAIRKYQIPIIVLEPEVGIESICRVFETINSTGTRLTTFDLAVARYFPQPDLRALLDSSKEKYAVIEEFQVDGDRILQTLACVFAAEDGRDVDPSRGVLLGLKREDVQRRWDEAASALAFALDWAKDHGARPDILPNVGILVSIAAIRMLKPELFDDTYRNFNSLLRRWYFTRALRPGSRASANWQIGSDFKNLWDYASKNIGLDFYEVVLSADVLMGMTSNQDNRFKAIQCVMAMTAKTDLMNGKTLSESPEHHHLYPRSLRDKEKLGVRIESICNRLAISQATNRSLGDQPPGVYLARISKEAKNAGIEKDVMRRFRECLLPYSDEVGTDGLADRYSVENFDQFLRARAELLLDRIGDLVGASLFRKHPGDEELDEREDESAA